MKRIFIVTSCAAALVYVLSCRKTDFNQDSCTGPKAVTDSAQLLAFAKKNSINPVADTSWIYYQVINPGTGSKPIASSVVYVRYTERLVMDGSLLDSAGIAKGFALNGTIKGWQYGLPKIKTGGRIKLLVPSALALSCSGNGSTIPPNAPLYFDIYLDSLK